MATENEIREAIAKHSNELMDIPGVTGVGLGKKLSSDGNTKILCMKIYVKELTDEMRMKVPKVIDGIETELFATGEIKAQ